MMTGMEVTAREGFTEIRCPSCNGTVHAPMGPDFWHPATGGYIKPKRGIDCACGASITLVTLDMLVSWPNVLP